MGIIRRAVDGLIDVFGHARGPALHQGGYVHCPLSAQQIQAAYLGSGLIRKIIDIPARDATREWRTWQADDADITKLEAEEKRLGIRALFERAHVLAGLGGGALILGLPGEPYDPAPTNIRAGDLAYIHAVSRYQLTMAEVVDDPADPLFGQPREFRMGTQRGEFRIHPSRVILFKGDPVPNFVGMAAADGFWGVSRIERIYEAAQNHDTAQKCFAAILKKARLTRVGIPKLLHITATDAGTQQLMRRFQAMVASESIYSATVYDSGDGEKGGERIDDIQQSWTGMPEIMYAFATFLAGVADVPLTRLIGRAAEGMNASGESQQKDWRKTVAAIQDLDLRPQMEALDQYLIPSALGSVPKDIWWQWQPLDKPTAAEEAARFKTTMEAVEKLQMTATIPDRAFAEAVQSMMVENGFVPGLEAALAAIPESERFGIEQEPGGDDPSALQAGGDEGA